MGALLWSIFQRKIREGAMSHVNRIIFALGIASVVVAGVSGVSAFAQGDPNSAPNPYHTVENWAKLPEGRTWGPVISADIDRARREVFGRRKIHQGMGKGRKRAGRIQQSPLAGHGFQRTVVRRRPREQPR